MTIKLYADIHHTPEDKGNKLGSQAIALLKQDFSSAASGKTGELRIGMGDLITARREGGMGDRRATDIQNMHAIMETLAAGHVHFHVHGNHEDENLTRSDVEGIASQHGLLIQSMLLRHEDLSVILWAPDASIRKENGGSLTVPKSELDHLSQMIYDARGPSIVLTHLPLDGDVTNFAQSNVDGRVNPVFGRGVSIPYATHYPNSAEIRDVISGSGKVMACIAGHTHWNEARMIDDVAYITLPSLVERFVQADGQSVAWNGRAAVNFNAQKDALRIDVYGQAPVSYDVCNAAHGRKLAIK